MAVLHTAGLVTQEHQKLLAQHCSQPLIGEKALFPLLEGRTGQWWMAHGSSPVLTQDQNPQRPWGATTPLHTSALGHRSVLTSAHRHILVHQPSWSGNHPAGPARALLAWSALEGWMRRAPCGELCHRFVTKAKGVQPHPVRCSGCEHPWRILPFLEGCSPCPWNKAPGASSLLPCPLQCPSLTGDKPPGQESSTSLPQGGAAGWQQRAGNPMRSGKNFPTSLPLSSRAAEQHQEQWQHPGEPQREDGKKVFPEIITELPVNTRTKLLWISGPWVRGNNILFINFKQSYEQDRSFTSHSALQPFPERSARGSSFCPFGFLKDPNEHMSKTSGSSTGQKSAHFYISHKRVFIKSQSYNCSFPKLVQVPSPTLALYYFKVFFGFGFFFFPPWNHRSDIILS